MPDYYDKPFAYAQYDERYGHGSLKDKLSVGENNKHGAHKSHDHHVPMAGDLATQQ